MKLCGTTTQARQTRTKMTQNVLRYATRYANSIAPDPWWGGVTYIAPINPFGVGAPFARSGDPSWADIEYRVLVGTFANPLATQTEIRHERGHLYGPGTFLERVQDLTFVGEDGDKWNVKIGFD